MEVIVREMLAYDGAWLTVPLEVKISVGPNWHEVKTIGKFSSALI
jgi:DNA polymerase I-like protein with 3'-5' exonuclease and polymerase domains